MKNILLALTLLVIFCADAQAANRYYAEFKDTTSKIGLEMNKVTDAQQIRVDYAGRTDGQAVYLGYAARGTATDVDSWIIYKMTYDGNNQMTTRLIAFDTWDNRTGATYA